MAWYDGGNGAGVWEGLPLSPTLKNVLHELCTAVNEREMFRASNSATVSSITRSSGTATATTSSAHALTTGDKVYMAGADQTEYNGVVTVTVTGSTTFTYSVSGSPATPATGTLRCRRPLTKFVYDDAGNTKYFPATTDFEDLPLSKIGTGPERSVYTSVTPTSITSSGGVATVTTNSAFVSSLTVGDTIEVSGASQSEYNGTFTVASKPTSTTFTYAISGSPASPATGTITVKRQGWITRSGTTVTARLPGHGFKDGDVVTISGAAQSEYNDAHTITAARVSVGSVVSITRVGSTATVTFDQAHGMIINDVFAVDGCTQTEYNGLQTVASVPSSTTITYSVSGSPATPATGTPSVADLTRFQFEIAGAPATPATGDIKATANRHMVTYATRSGSTATITCYDHGFSTGDYVEALGTNGTPDGWAFYGPVTVTDANTFTATITGTPTSGWIPGALGTICVTKEGEFRKLLRQLQAAIAGLLTASTSASVIRFVEDSTPYETNYTLANLLGAGSYGSAWVSLQKLARASLDDVLDQMREALDLLVVTTVTGTATTQSHDVNSSKGTGSIEILSMSESGGVFTVNLASAHFLETGDQAFVSNDDLISASYWNKDYIDTVTKIDSDTFEMPATLSSGKTDSANYCFPSIAVETAWDNAVSGSPYTSVNSDTGYVSRRYCNHGVIAVYDNITYYQVSVEYEADAIFATTPTRGTLVVGEIYLQETNNGDKTQDTYTLTDSDGDTATIDASIGTTDELITVTKTSAFFADASKTLTFTTPTPASHPFNTALGNDETTQRYVTVRESNASKHTRELVPGTHLTYG